MKRIARCAPHYAYTPYSANRASLSGETIASAILSNKCCAGKGHAYPNIYSRRRTITGASRLDGRKRPLRSAPETNVLGRPQAAATFQPAIASGMKA